MIVFWVTERGAENIEKMKKIGKRKTLKNEEKVKQRSNSFCYKKGDRLCVEFSWNPNTKCTEVSQSSISTHPFLIFPFFQKYLNPRLNQQNGQQCCLPPLSFKISHKDTFFYISWNSLVFYLSPKCLLNFF